MGKPIPRLIPNTERLLHGLADKEKKEGFSKSYNIDGHLLEELGFKDKDDLQHAVDSLYEQVHLHLASWGNNVPLIAIQGRQLSPGVKCPEAWDWYQDHTST